MKKKILFFFLCICLLTGCSYGQGNSSDHPNQPSGQEPESTEQSASLPSAEIPEVEEKEPYYFLIQENAYNSYGGDAAQDLVIMNEKGEIVHTISNVIHKGNPGEVAVDACLILGLSGYMNEDGEWDSSIRYGIFSLEQMDWVREPEKCQIQAIETDTTTFYSIMDEDWMVTEVLDEDMNKFSDSSIQQYEDRIWMSDSEENKTTIVDMNGTVINTLNYSSYVGDGWGKYALLMDGWNQVAIADPDGNIIFDKDTFLNKNPDWEDKADETFYISYYNTKDQLVDVEVGTNQMLICKLDGELLFDDPDYYYEMQYAGSYIQGTSYLDDDQNTFFDMKGVELIPMKGDQYVKGIDGDSLVSQDENGYYLENLLYKTCWKLEGYDPHDDNTNVVSFSENIYAVEIWKEIDDDFVCYSKLYNKNEQIAYTQNCFSTTYGDDLMGIVMQNYSMDDSNSYQSNLDFFDAETGDGYFQRNFIFNKEGEKIYQSAYRERIFAANEDYILLLQGNYLKVVDYEGNTIYQALSTDMQKD